MNKQIFKPTPNANSRKLSSIWGDFINWDKRLETEGPFLLSQLKRHGCRRVFDAALGEGVVSIFLLKNGFDVISNELDPEFRKRAAANAKREGVVLDIRSHFWQDIHKHLKKETFDAVICDGNSLCCENRASGRQAAVRNFHLILRKGGILEVDERNFDYIIRNRTEIMGGNFRYSGNFIYCGDRIHAIPVRIATSNVIMQYTDIASGKGGRLRIYPFKDGELVSLLKTENFHSVETFSDFKPGIDLTADFFMHVAVK